MSVILAHNFYQLPGGEDRAFEAEAELLRSRGHEVIPFVDHNDRIQNMGRARLALSTLWNWRSYERLSQLVRKSRAQIVHFHNTFPLLSPSCYYAAKREGAAVVQTLHNYRLICPNALLFREGHPCESCTHHAFFWPAIAHTCYRSSRSATAVTSAMLTLHRMLGTWTKRVDAYIALTDFARSKFVASGLPARKVYIKPNFLEQDPGVGTEQGRYGLFVGRLVKEKGLHSLLRAWKLLNGSVPLKIVGAGPLAGWLQEQMTSVAGIEWTESLSRVDLLNTMKRAIFLVVPSIWYEGFPLVIVEAFAVGCPVISSNIGPLSSIVDHGRTGLHFTPGNAWDLACKLRRFLSFPNGTASMRRQARLEFERRYSAETNYSSLLSIYTQALRGGEESLHIPK